VSIAVAAGIKHGDFHPGKERDGVAKYIASSHAGRSGLFLTTKIRKAAPGTAPGAAAAQAIAALEKICYESGLSTQRHDTPSVKKANSKTGRGDLLIKDANIGGDQHLIIDVTCTHEFCGNHLRDVGRNGQLRDHDVNKLLETTARTKVTRYCEAYATRSGTTYAFLPCVMSTSGRIDGEFLRLLYILAHRRTLKYVADMGEAEPGTDAFTWRRSQYRWQHKAAIGFGNAVAVARRAHLAHPPRPRQRARAPRHPPLPYADILCLPPRTYDTFHLLFIWCTSGLSSSLS